MSLPNAFVTLLTTPSYLPGALVLLHALTELHPAPRDFQIVCLVTPETVDAKTIGTLREAGYDLVIGVEPIGSGVGGGEGLRLMGRPDLNMALTKLHLFRLGNVFSTLIYLDADVLPLRPLSHLFETTQPHVLSACSDTGWPDCFNSGVMVVRPRDEDWEGMRRMLLEGEGEDGIYDASKSFDGADQGLLNEWFSEEGGGGNWNRLSFTYNVTPSAAYTYAPAYKRYGSKINVVHFIGPNKPWANLSSRPAGVSTIKGKEMSYDYPSLIDRWYDIYDRHVRPNAVFAPDNASRFSVPENVAIWNQTAGGGVPHQPSDRMDLDALKAATQWGVTTYAKGQYTSMPLDGRVDLIMPKPKPRQSINKRVSFVDSPPPKEEESGPAGTPVSDEPISGLVAPGSPTVQASPVRLVAPKPQTFEQQFERPATWDASRYSPPKDSGPEMAIPFSTVYHSAWDQPAQQQTAWYQAPPQQVEPRYPTLPANVVADPWYKEYSGQIPDRANIQAVFPWEEKNKSHAPSRVFPREASPPPSFDRKSSSSDNQAAAASAAEPPINVQSPPRQVTPPPLPEPPKSMAEAMASYRNAWDDDAGIKRYIDMITGISTRPGSHGRHNSQDRGMVQIVDREAALKSVPGTPRRQHSHTDRGLHSRATTHDREASSASEFGDDEDEGEDGDDTEGERGTSSSSPSAGRRGSSSMAKPRVPTTKNRSTGAAGGGGGTNNGGSKYRDRHVQTDRSGMLDQKVQADAGSSPSSSATRNGATVRRGSRDLLSSQEGISTRPPGRTFSSTETVRATVSPQSELPITIDNAQVRRGGAVHVGPRPPLYALSVSGDFGQPAGPVATGTGSGSSPPEAANGQTHQASSRSARSWDPSTDIDMRRRDTQEVLSRFMKAGTASGGQPARQGPSGNRSSSGGSGSSTPSQR